jgi:hypothetical protein
MGSAGLHRLRYQWPLAGVLLTFLTGLAIGGVGGGVLAGTLSVLVFGPAYLAQNTIRRQRGTLPVPPTRTPEEKARLDARALRLYAISEVIVASVVALLVATGRPSWLSDSAWTPLLLLAVACGFTAAPSLWATAERRATGRCLRWAWALTAVFDVAFGLAAVVIALTNAHSQWLGGPIWTIAFGLAAALWLLSAPGALALARRKPRRSRPAS